MGKIMILLINHKISTEPTLESQPTAATGLLLIPWLKPSMENIEDVTEVTSICNIIQYNTIQYYIILYCIVVYYIILYYR
jgi:hypothetical protein